MGKGRRPKPTLLKIVEGNKGKRRLDMEAEPRPELGAPECPEHLAGEARREWERIAPELERMGLLTGVDMAGLAGYCACWATVVESERILAGEGYVVQGRDSLKTHPAQTVRNQAYGTMHRFLLEFGFTPASRSRIKVDAPGKIGLEEMLK